MSSNGYPSVTANNLGDLLKLEGLQIKRGNERILTSFEAVHKTDISGNKSPPEMLIILMKVKNRIYSN